MPEAPNSIIIRAAEAPDAEAIARVRVAAWRAAYRGLMPDSYLDRADLEGAEAEQLRDRLANIGSTARVSVAEIGGRIAGYCAYGRSADDDARLATGAVYDLYVHPDSWRQGVGRRLLMYATDYFKAQGFGEATLFVFEENTRAREFYEQAGWQPDGHREIYEWSGLSRPVLRYRTLHSCSFRTDV
jgi:ribosomal protein S18 acetylase RimI-like enzyme